VTILNLMLLLLIGMASVVSLLRYLWQPHLIYCAYCCRSGKSSIERVVFHKMSPHETLFLESTHNVDINLIANNNFVKFQTWDFGGDVNFSTDITINSQSKRISSEHLFKNCSTLVYVIDAQEDYEDELPKLVETISLAYGHNPMIHFEVFLVMLLPPML
jgi:Ras-related GTP-binding protein C/D